MSLLLLGAAGTPGVAADSDAAAGLTLLDDAIASTAVNAGDTVVVVHLAGDTVTATSGSEAKATAGLMLGHDAVEAAGGAGERRRADPNAGTLA